MLVFSHPSALSCALGAQKNRLIETQWDDSFEHPKYNFLAMDKKMVTLLNM